MLSAFSLIIPGIQKKIDVLSKKNNRISKNQLWINLCRCLFLILQSFFQVEARVIYFYKSLPIKWIADKNYYYYSWL